MNACDCTIFIYDCKWMHFFFFILPMNACDCTTMIACDCTTMNACDCTTMNASYCTTMNASYCTMTACDCTTLQQFYLTLSFSLQLHYYSQDYLLQCSTTFPHLLYNSRRTTLLFLPLLGKCRLHGLFHELVKPSNLFSTLAIAAIVLHRLDHQRWNHFQSGSLLAPTIQRITEVLTALSDKSNTSSRNLTKSAPASPFASAITSTLSPFPGTLTTSGTRLASQHDTAPQEWSHPAFPSPQTRDSSANNSRSFPKPPPWHDLSWTHPHRSSRYTTSYWQLSHVLHLL